MARKPATDKPLSRRVLVLIHRDQTAATSRVLWQHEIPILEAIFGEGNVKPVDASTLDEGYNPKASPEMLIFNKKQDPIAKPSESQGLGYVFIGDPRVEYDRLANLYGRHPDVNETFAEHVYGRFQRGDFARLVGKPELDDLPDAQLLDLARSYGAEPEKLAAAKTSDAVLALAQSVGVDIG